MPPRNDLTGKIFENLEVLEYLEPDKRRNYRYLCVCICGNFTIVPCYALTSGNTKSCGCLLDLSRRAYGFISSNDLTGKKFGKLTVLKQVFDQQGFKRRARFLCRCDCGNEKVVVGNDLSNGKTKACGCVQKESLKKLNERRWEKKSNLDST